MILKLLDDIKVEHIVKILNVEPVARNVKRFILEKPVGYSFVAGQATDISINQPGLTGNTLLFANYAEEDIILRAELKYMLGDQYVDILKTPTKPGQ